MQPLLYAKRVRRVDPQARPGDAVAVYHEDGNLLGYALFNPKSAVPLRMVRRGPEVPDDAFWQRQLERAVALRRDWLRLDDVTDAYRVLHAEADGFSGLAVDRFGDVLVAEAFSLAMAQRTPEILARLAPLTGARHTVLKAGPQTLAHEGFAFDPIVSPDAPATAVIQEFGTQFAVPLAGGHKTGFFCDQRDNRRRLAELCRDRTVLDICCYTGGFSVQAKALGQAAEVIGVDLDEEPLRLARANAQRNRVRVQFVQADAFPYLRDAAANGRRFGVVVLDPPKLIRSRAEYEDGARKHHDLNRLAIPLVEPGGLLLTCSCAGLLPEEEFLRLVHAAARKAGRTVRVLAVGGAAPDHPVAPECPETRYLKAVWLQVD